jgi:hypothetical protein
MKERVSLWIGIAVLVSAIFFLPFGSITGNPILTNDTTLPVLNIPSSSVNSNDVATINYYASDPESGITSVYVYGPVESTGLIRGGGVKQCNGNTSCTGSILFSYEPSYDNNGNTYRVVANSTSGQTTRDVVLVFNGEGNQSNSSCSNECSISGQLQCFGSYSKTCGNYDSDSCLEWSSGTLCQYGCTGGNCLPNPGNQTNQTSCTDSDGGDNIYVYGVTTNSSSSVNDTCIVSASNYAPTLSSNTLREYVCLGSTIDDNIHTCPTGQTCNNGACVQQCTPESISVTCEGIVCGSKTNNCGQSVDCGTCPSGSVCGSNGQQCIPTVMPFCSDSDGGLNYNLPGTVVTNNNNYTDFCNATSTTLLNEYSCSGTSMAVSQYNCPQGCDLSIGACKFTKKKVSTCKSLYCAVRDALLGKNKT